MNFLLLATLMFFQTQNKTVYVDRIAVKVNDKVITERELVHMYKTRRAEVLQRYRGAELDQKLREAWESNFSDAEENLLLYEKAIELGIAKSEDETRSRLMAVKESNGLSDKEFEEAVLKEVGMTLQEYVDHRKREDSAQAVIHSQIIARIQIDDSEIAKYYAENQDAFMLPETYRIAEIVFFKEEGQETLTRTKMLECLDLLNQGGDFEEAAKKYSDSPSKENGGDLGDVLFGDLNKTIEDKVRAMDLNDITDFETEHAYFVIKLINRTQPTPKPLPDVREEIIQRLRLPRMESQLSKFIQELRGQYRLVRHISGVPWYMEL